MIQPYRVLMDDTVNPLRRLSPMVRFQVMTALSFMWSAIFTLWLGSTWLLGPTVGAHLLLLLGVLLTAKTFRWVRERPLSYDETFRNPQDGCARHDDVWGGARVLLRS